MFDSDSATWSYILADTVTKYAALIDPVREQKERDLKLLTEMGLILTHVLETHIHADHITGAAALKDETGALIVYGAVNKVEGADLFLRDDESILIGQTRIKALATPGHTDGCTSYLLEGTVFTGDALLIRGCGRTDFQSGSAQALYKSITEKLYTLPDETLIYPGHDYKGMLCSTIGEEKAFNPRIHSETTLQEFVTIMDNLKLDHPRKIDIAVPANLKAGRT